MIAAVLPCTAIPRSDLSHVCVCVMASSAVAPLPVYLGVCGMCSGTNALQSCVPAVQSYCGADPDADYPAFCSMCTAQSPQDGCVATTQQMCTACDFDQYQSAYNALSTCMAAGTMCDCEFQSQDFLIASQRCGMPVATWVKDLMESAPDVCSAGATCTSAIVGTVVQRCALKGCFVHCGLSNRRLQGPSRAVQPVEELHINHTGVQLRRGAGGSECSAGLVRHIASHPAGSTD